MRLFFQRDARTGVLHDDLPRVAAELAVGAKAGGGGSGGIGQMMFVFYAYSVELNGIVVCMAAVGIVALLLDRVLREGLARAVPWSRA